MSLILFTRERLLIMRLHKEVPLSTLLSVGLTCFQNLWQKVYISFSTFRVVMVLFHINSWRNLANILKSNYISLFYPADICSLRADVERLAFSVIWVCVMIRFLFFCLYAAPFATYFLMLIIPLSLNYELRFTNSSRCCMQIPYNVVIIMLRYLNWRRNCW